MGRKLGGKMGGCCAGWSRGGAAEDGGEEFQAAFEDGLVKSNRVLMPGQIRENWECAGG